VRFTAVSFPISAADGRAHKTRTKGTVHPLVDQVALVKDDPVKPKDVMKAAATLNGFTATYQQSFRAIEANRSNALEKNKRSFELLIPYLQKFMELNPGSTTMTEIDGEEHMQKLFVCPGLMT
jgi:hypothetical protein